MARCIKAHVKGHEAANFGLAKDLFVCVLRGFAGSEWFLFAYLLLLVGCFGWVVITS